MNDDYYNFAKEDGIVEYTTTLLYFLSFVFSLVITINFIKVKKAGFASLYILLSGVFLFAGFEEISWGQRIFLLETTEFFSENAQNETNFHNLHSLKSYVDKIFFLIGFYGAFSWIFLSKLKTPRFNSFKKFFVPKGFLMFYFLPAFLFYVIVRIRYFLSTPPEVISYFFAWPDDEVVELVLSAGIFLFIFSKILGWKSIKNS